MLIIGGGDGGVIREVVKHPQVEEVVLCEIDSAIDTDSSEDGTISNFLGCDRCKQKVSSRHGNRICAFQNNCVYY